MNILNNVIGRPWAIHGEIADTVRRMIAHRGFSSLRDLASLRSDLKPPSMEATFQDVAVAVEPMAAGSASSSGASTARVAVLSMRGMFTQHGDAVDCEPTLSLDEFAMQVQSLANNPNVSGVVLAFDSPGGTVQGTPEAAAVLRAARASKPFVAYSNSMIASAAYWLASNATEVWGCKSSSVGSIGVYCCHEYIGEALKAQGVTVELISSEGSPFKTEGTDLLPLGAAARQAMQDEVDRFYDMFISDVAEGRGIGAATVRSSFGKGRMVPIDDAVDAKMADGVGTLQEVVDRTAKLSRRMESKANRADAITPTFEADLEFETRTRARRK